jgi:hypothetical protein
MGPSREEQRRIQNAVLIKCLRGGMSVRRTVYTGGHEGGR